MDNNELMSLYDYLGKAAGRQLGEEVNKAAQIKRVAANSRQVDSPNYKGIVMLYPKWFLDEYFGNPEEEDDDELPF
jgi:hypothetical protein